MTIEVLRKRTKGYPDSFYRASDAGLIIQPDPYYANVSLLLYMKGVNNSTTFTDEKGHSVSVNGNAKISTTQSNFDGSSGYFDGTGDYLSIADSTDFEVGSNDYTIEFWAYTSSTVSYSCLLSRRNSSFTGGMFALYFNSGATGNVSFYIGSIGLLFVGSTSIANSQWNHVAISRNGNNTRLFINGVQDAISTTNYTITDESLPLVIGIDSYNSIFDYLGYMSNFRFTKGVGRYTATFTPSITPFPNF